MGWLTLTFWVLYFWRLVGGFLGILTKKERLCITCIIDAILIVLNVVQALTNIGGWEMYFSVPFAILFTHMLRVDYRAWKNTDDDDEWKSRRKSWAKSHLPKPITRTIPQPV